MVPPGGRARRVHGARTASAAVPGAGMGPTPTPTAVPGDPMGPWGEPEQACPHDPVLRHRVRRSGGDPGAPITRVCLFGGDRGRRPGRWWRRPGCGRCIRRRGGSCRPTSGGGRSSPNGTGTGRSGTWPAGGWSCAAATGSTWPGGSRSWGPGRLRFAGRVDHGLVPAARRRVRELLGPLVTPESPFAEPEAALLGGRWARPRPGDPAPVFVRPEVAVEVSFLGWESGRLRHPAYAGPTRLL